MRSIKNIYQSAIRQLAPDIHQQIEEADIDRMSEEEYSLLTDSAAQADGMIERHKRKKRHVIAAFSSIAVTAAAICCIFLFNTSQVRTIVALDINPGIELYVKGNERVKKVQAVNEEAKQILKDMDLDNVDLDVAVYAIIGSVISNGYLEDENAEILLSIQNDNPEYEQKLEKNILGKIGQALKENNLQATILKQKIDMNKTIQKIADVYSVSIGKAQILYYMTESDSDLSLKKLSAYPIKKLLQLASDRNIDLDHVLKTVNSENDAVSETPAPSVHHLKKTPKPAEPSPIYSKKPNNENKLNPGRKQSDHSGRKPAAKKKTDTKANESSDQKPKKKKPASRKNNGTQKNTTKNKPAATKEPDDSRYQDNDEDDFDDIPDDTDHDDNTDFEEDGDEEDEIADGDGF